MTKITYRKVKRYGNVFLVTIPIDFVKENDINKGDRLKVEIIDDTLIIEPYKINDVLEDL